MLADYHLTNMELQAIKAAKHPLHLELVRLGIVEAFNHCSADQIEELIAAVWAGIRASMKKQSDDGEIPF